MKKIFILLLILFLIFFSTLHGETIPKDANFWSTLNVEKKLTRSIGLSFSEELRLFDNVSRINQYFTNFGINYKINKSFKVALVYRFINVNQYEYYSKRHHLYFDISYKKPVNNFNFTYRVRLQGQVKDINSSDDGKNIESYIRHKFVVEYDYNKFIPYLAAEYRFQISNPGFYEGNGLWNRYRFYAGSDYKINRQNSCGLYYMIQRGFNSKNIEIDYVLGVEYSFSF